MCDSYQTFESCAMHKLLKLATSGTQAIYKAVASCHDPSLAD